jgi:hypothetical protein
MRRRMTNLLLFLLVLLNSKKDTGLSQNLHALADMYDTRPTGAWLRFNGLWLRRDG